MGVPDKNFLNRLLATFVVGCGLLQNSCALFRPKVPSVTVGSTHVDAPKDVGKAATIDQSEAHSELSIPKGTQVTVTHTDAVTGQGNGQSAPAKTVTTWDFQAPASFLQFDTATHAQTGTTDTTVATHAQDVAARQPLLYAAILAGLAACLFVYLQYPTVAMLLGGAAGLFFLSWKLSEMPTWTWVVGAVAAAIGATLYVHHERLTTGNPVVKPVVPPDQPVSTPSP